MKNKKMTVFLVVIIIIHRIYNLFSSNNVLGTIKHNQKLYLF